MFKFYDDAINRWEPALGSIMALGPYARYQAKGHTCSSKGDGSGSKQFIAEPRFPWVLRILNFETVSSQLLFGLWKSWAQKAKLWVRKIGVC